MAVIALSVQKVAFFLPGASLCPTNFRRIRRHDRVTKRIRIWHPQPLCCQNRSPSPVPARPHQVLLGSVASRGCTDWSCDDNLRHQEHALEGLPADMVPLLACLHLSASTLLRTHRESRAIITRSDDATVNLLLCLLAVLVL